MLRVDVFVAVYPKFGRGGKGELFLKLLCRTEQLENWLNRHWYPTPLAILKEKTEMRSKRREEHERIQYASRRYAQWGTS